MASKATYSHKILRTPGHGRTAQESMSGPKQHPSPFSLQPRLAQGQASELLADLHGHREQESQGQDQPIPYQLTGDKKTF